MSNTTDLKQKIRAVAHVQEAVRGMLIDEIMAEIDTLAATPAQPTEAPDDDPTSKAQYLNCGDLTDLRHLDEVFSDGEGWDLPKERMARLCELGVIRHNGGGRYSITSFGCLALGNELIRLPLETFYEFNARIGQEHNAKMNAQGSQAND
ncbi:hypothetical protein SAMN05216344_10688 [Polaromonas sp. OV174]|uniref:hypothetical protein n=1 Tax=Polaromonas sp. OV174 TaxID=1855300 RepID=UPI0008F289A6|nr:hypothetical protein [Polaromonas sp. OV174]SFB95854.1 hypothetical protein SAMN05216344_10688 [Polaromonas sp. OV174]